MIWAPQEPAGGTARVRDEAGGRADRLGSGQGEKERPRHRRVRCETERQRELETEPRQAPPVVLGGAPETGRSRASRPEIPVGFAPISSRGGHGGLADGAGGALLRVLRGLGAPGCGRPTGTWRGPGWGSGGLLTGGLHGQHQGSGHGQQRTSPGPRPRPHGRRGLVSPCRGLRSVAPTLSQRPERGSLTVACGQEAPPATPEPQPVVSGKSMVSGGG